jgi:anthranilate synthase component 2/para-aminobenzoate synthetase component 2
MILLIDNYDSFTYNVAHALGKMGYRPHVVRNDAASPAELEGLDPSAILISPGPGRPEDAGISCDVVERFAGRVPMLGVCLGHQCMARVLGAQVVVARRQVHGKTSDVFHDGRTIYHNLRNPFNAARYHSLIVPEESVKAPLEVSAYTLEGEVMGLRSTELMMEGVQFHPESIATPQGAMVFRNFAAAYLTGRKAA